MEGFWATVTEELRDAPAGGRGVYLGRVDNELKGQGGIYPVLYTHGDLIRIRAEEVWCATPDFEPETVKADPYLRFMFSLAGIEF